MAAFRPLPAIALLAVACAPLPPAAPPVVSVAGNQWRIVEVNGRATPAPADYSMRFVSGQLSARFGCNHMGGRYRIAGGILTVGDLAQTLMGCPEPAASLEQQGSSILAQPMRIAESTSGRVTLMNERGSIALERR